MPTETDFVPTQKNTQNPKYSEYHLIKPFVLEGETLGYIAIHNVNRGPALGGTRIFPYRNAAAALQDALRLSKAMTYKCAIANLPFGGGKGVIIADPAAKGLSKILQAYARTVDELKGLFHTGEDVGLSEANVQHMLRFSPYFIGKSNLAGDPSPFAGQSAYLCAKVALNHLFGSASLTGRTVIIKGVGKTGSTLARLFAHDGARVIVGDVNIKAVERLQKELPNIESANPDKLIGMETDIYSPCALGNDITLKNLGKIKAKLIVGTANNQLEDTSIAKGLLSRGILHVPDYVANAGGLIDVADELLPGGYNRNRVMEHIKDLQYTLARILRTAANKKLDANTVADAQAERLFASHKKHTKKKMLAQ